VKSAARVFWTGFVLNFKILAASPFMVMTAALGMGFAIDGERWSRTLSAVLATPANRGALFLGRAVPVLLNAAVTSATGFVGGALLLDFRPPWSAVPTLALLVVLASFACTGLGMLTGAVGLRMRDVAIIANLTMAVLLIFCGVNIPLDKLPGWMHATAVFVELALGTVYLVAGFALLRWFESQGLRHGTLDRA
jgi:ABC-2 type transport system permease protein